MSNEVTTEIPLKVNVTVAAEDAVVAAPAEPVQEEAPAAPEPEPEPVSEPAASNNDVWRPEPRRSWISGRSILAVLILAALIVLGYQMWQGRGAFLTIERGVEPFTNSGELIQPQDITNSTIILEEYFTQPRGSWTFSPPNQASFFGEGLLLEDNIYTGGAWATPGLLFEDFVLKVDTRWLGGSLSGEYGLQIRKDGDTGEYLALYLHNDGRFTVAQQTRRSFTVLANQYNAAIKVNGEINSIQIEAVDERVYFFVNDAYLGTFNASLPADGEIEFIATKGEGGDLYMAGFDNLIITHNFVEQSADG